MTKIHETKTVTVPIPDRLADLIHFARRCRMFSEADYYDDAKMVQAARDFWDSQHGE